MILVLNLGLKSIRAIVFDDNGAKRASAARTVKTMLTGGWIEQDPEEWWRLALEVMKGVLTDSEVRHGLQGITVTSSSCCLVCLDRENRVLRPAIMVSDNRALCEARELGKSEAFLEARESNGNLAAEPSLMIPKVMWLQRHEKEVFENTAMFLASNDFLVRFLCGEAVTDPLNAEKFCYRPREGKYSERLMQEEGIPLDKLPRVAAQGTVAGELLESVKKSMGITSRLQIPVILTTYDAICAFFGSGTHEEGDACDVSGTVTSLRVLSQSSCHAEGSSIYSQYEAQTGSQIVGGSNNLGGGLIEWAKQCFYVGEPDPYTMMEYDAGEGGLGAEGLVFLPYLLGERAPLWDSDARGVFFGLERRHQRQHLVRSVFESAAYSLVFLKEAIEAVGCDFKRLRVSGGLARIDLIAQIKADVLQTEVDVLEEFETTSMGAFLLASMALGRIGSLADAASFVRVRRRMAPDGERGRRYGELVKFYKELYHVSRPLFVKRQRLMEVIYDKHAVSIENL